jgi:hypothetical protein
MRQKWVAALQSLAHDRNPFVAAEAGLYLIREGIAIEPKPSGRMGAAAEQIKAVIASLGAAVK